MITWNEFENSFTNHPSCCIGEHEYIIERTGGSAIAHFPIPACIRSIIDRSIISASPTGCGRCQICTEEIIGCRHSIPCLTFIRGETHASSTASALTSESTIGNQKTITQPRNLFLPCIESIGSRKDIP